MNAPVTRRKVLLMSGRRSQGESLPLHGDLPQEPVEDLEGNSSARTEVVAGAVVFPTPPQHEDTMSKNKDAGVTRQKFIDLFEREKRWLAVAEIAAALDVSRVSCKYHLTALDEQGAIKSRGNTHARRYAHASVADIVLPHAGEQTSPPAPKKRKPALRRKTVRARKARRINPVPITRAQPGPALERSKVICAISDSGALGITKGDEKLALSSDEIEQVIRFLEHTQLVWRKAA